MSKIKTILPILSTGAIASIVLPTVCSCGPTSAVYPEGNFTTDQTNQSTFTLIWDYHDGESIEICNVGHKDGYVHFSDRTIQAINDFTSFPTCSEIQTQLNNNHKFTTTLQWDSPAFETGAYLTFVFELGFKINGSKRQDHKFNIRIDYVA